MKFTPDSKFFQLCVRLLELVKLNILWLLCCLPVFTAGAATTAMLSCLYARRAGDPCGARAFFRFFRQHFRRATLLWLGILFFAVMLAVDYYLVAYMVFPGRMAVIGIIFFAAFALMMVAAIAFPLVSQFPGSLKDTVVNAVLLSIANLPKLLLVTAMNLLPAALVILLPQVFLLTGFVWLLFGFSLIAMYDIQVLERIFAPFREAAV